MHQREFISSSHKGLVWIAFISSNFHNTKIELAYKFGQTDSLAPNIGGARVMLGHSNKEIITAFGATKLM